MRRFLLLALALVNIATPALGQPEPSRIFAFLVACGDYDPSELKAVPFTLPEMNQFRDVLINSGVPAKNVIYLHDKTDQPGRLIPNRANILREYRLLLERLRPQDSLIVALSGHGVQFKTDATGYFCPLDAKLVGRDAKKTLVPLAGDDGLVTLLEQAKAERKLVLVNACRDDPAADAALAAQKFEFRNDYNEEAPKGTVIVFACGKGQRSYFYPGTEMRFDRRSRSLFMYHLTKAWDGEYSWPRPEAYEKARQGGGEMPQRRKVTLDHVLTETLERVESDAIKDFRNNQIPLVKKSFSGSWLLVPEYETRDTAQTAKELAPKITKAIIAKQGSAQFRVAVFAPGDEKGRVTVKNANSSLSLQGELINQLMQIGKGKFFVLDRAGLTREFLASQVDPAGINADDPKGSANLLAKVGIDVAILTGFDINRKSVDVPVVLVFGDGSATNLDGVTQTFPPGITHPSGRFSVDILMQKPGGEWAPIPIVAEFPGRTPLYAEIPRDIKLNSKQAAYKIRIKNHGKPIIRYENDKDRSRLYSVAVQIDGVNSMFQKRPDGSIGPFLGHARNASHWIISGPNDLIVADSSSPGGFRLQKSTGPGHSIIEIPGFQKDDNVADEFIFVNGRDSLASTLGVTSSIGIITVTFFSEDLPGDQLPRRLDFAEVGRGGADFGTRPGDPVANPVFTVSPKMKAEIAEEWQIFYRQEGSLPFAKGISIYESDRKR